MNENNVTTAQEPEITETEAEIIKALAYGKTPQEIAEAETVTVKAVTDIYAAHWQEITDARAKLENGGFFNGD